MSTLYQNTHKALLVAALQLASMSSSASADTAHTPVSANSGVLTVIDTAIDDWQTLLEATGDSDVLLLGGDREPLVQINERLRELGQVAALHIVSHGSAGALHFAQHSYSLESSQGTWNQWRELGEYVQEGGDILLYGCEVADGDTGYAFVKTLSDVTRRDVAASIDKTGAQHLNGNWNLEVHTGQLEVPPLTNRDYSGLLQPYTLSFLAGDPDLDPEQEGYTHPSIVRSVGGRDFTISGGEESGGLAYDDGGIYAFEGPDAEVKLTIEIEAGYTFDISGFKANAYSESISFDITYANGTTSGPSSSSAVNGSLAQISSFSPAIEDITKIVITSTNYAIFQDFIIDDIKPMGAANTAPVAGLGGAVNFESARSEGAQVADNAALDMGSGSFTVEAWIKRASVTGGFYTIAAKQDSAGWYFRLNSNTLNFTTAFNSGSGNSVSAASDITDTNWHHVVGVHDASAKTLAIYIDGALSNGLTYSSAANVDNAQAFGIGFKPGWGEYFNGTIDDVRLWNTVRTTEQIREYMHTPLAGSESGLVGYWNFEEGSGTSAANHSVTSGVNGTLQNSDSDEWVTGNIPYSATTNEDINISLRLGGSDVDSQSVATAVITDLPDHGVLRQTNDGSTLGTQISATGTALTDTEGNPRRVIFVPMLNYSGSDSFTYKVNDGSTDSANTVTVNLSIAATNDEPTATNLTQSKSATEAGGAIGLDDVIVTDIDTGEMITATFTMSNAAAGTLSTGTFGSATSTFNAGTGVWTVTGSVADVNAALAAVAFTPSANNDQNFTITTRIRDAEGTGPADGTITVTVTAQNDAPSTTNLTQSKSAVEGGGAIGLDDVVVTDVDAGDTITATFAMSNATAGTLSTGTFGSATSTFNAGTGVWTVTGSVADVNAALAAVAFTPSANNDQNFTITTRIRDASNAGPADGTISFTVTGTYTVTYDANSATSGTVPVDASPYANGATVTVLGNTGALVRTGYSFSGWNTAADGSGTDRVASETFSMGTANVMLYAKWAAHTAPGAPTIGTATAGDAQASVTFTAPASNGGSDITGYTVTASPGDFTGTGLASPITVTGLTNGTAYTFTVTATNDVGTGTASSASISVTPKGTNTITFTNPGAQNFGTTPTLTATSSSGDTVTFTSATTGVCTITTGGLLTFVTAGTCTINADEDGNAAYAAATQASQSFTVNAIAPDAPTIGTAIADSMQASVSFTAPASTGGAAVTGYTVTSTPGSLTATGAASPITITGLTNGVDYTFTVTATNSAGTGGASAASNSVTPKGTNTITFTNPGAQNFGTTPTLTATATSTEAVTFTSSTTGVCTITTGGQLTFVTAGTCTIDANEDGNTSFLAATQASQSFTVNAVVPDVPTAPTATAGDTQAMVSFTAPVSNGGSAITGYTVTSSPGHLTASGTASPITVTGLMNGTAYTFTVTATNGVGTGAASAASNSVTPDTPPGSSDDNPFNPGGTQTQNNLDATSGVEPTRAPSDIVTNLDKLDNRVGISDNGVVVVLDNGLKEPVKFRDNPPDNVLISMPSDKPLDVQMNGNTLHIHIDPETPNPPKQTILSTTTLLLPDGTQAKGLQLVQGETSIGNTEPDSALGGLELSKDETLRTVVAQSGSGGGTAGFAKSLDGSGSVSAEFGEIVVEVRLKEGNGNTGVSTLMQAMTLPGAAGTAVYAVDTSTLILTLKAGEVARFDTLGELEGVFLGSLSGKIGKTGDTFALTAPNGVATYPATTLVFDGGNVPARIGMPFSDFMNAQLAGQLHFVQRSDGVMEVTSPNGGRFYARTLRGFEVVPSAADGPSANGDGSLSLTYGGIRSTWLPMLEDAADLARYFNVHGGFVTEVLENGSVQLSSGTGHFFVARPRHALRNVFNGAQGVTPVAPGDSALFYTNARNQQQQLDPAFHDEAQLRRAAAAQGWMLARSGLGGNNLTVTSPEGIVYQVVPNFRVDVLSNDDGLSGVIRQEDGRLYFYYADEPLRQGFTLK